MRLSTINLDKIAIGFSLVCAVHCLLLPIALVMLPSLAATLLGDESFHRWMLIVVLPTSVIALALGCRKHRNRRILSIGLVGLSALVFVALFGHDLLGELGEKIATVAAAALISLSHWQNHRQCQHLDCHH